MRQSGIYPKNIKEYVSTETHQLIFPMHNEEEENEDVDQDEDAIRRAVWIYSFWGRRNNEGIRETVYKTLIKLNNLYDEGFIPTF